MDSLFSLFKGSGGNSTNDAPTTQPQGRRETRSMSLSTAANVAAACESISSPQKVAHNPSPSEKAQQIMDEGQVDLLLMRYAELKHENQGLRSQLVNTKRDSKAAEVEVTTSTVDDLHKEIEQERAERKKAEVMNRDHLHQYQSAMTQMEERVKRRNGTIQQQGQIIDNLQKNMEILEHNHNVNVFDHHNVVASLKQQLTSATTKISALENSLEECKERIFKLQPFEAKPDTEIASMYESLCDTITGWVADIFDKIGETSEMSNGMAAITANSELMNTQAAVFGSGMATLVKDHPVTDELVLSSFIFLALSRTILDVDDICFGLDQSKQEFLYRIMEGLTQVKPTKDLEAIEMWRVDTYRALSAVNLVTKNQKELKEDSATKLLGCLKAVAPGGIDKSSRGACRQVVDECTSLAHEMRLTTATYRWVTFDAESSGSELLRGYEMQKYKLMDIKTGQALKRSAIKEHGEETVIGEKLCSIFPALHREGGKDKKELRLSKETILVHIDDKFRQQKQKRTQAGGSPSKG